MLIKIDSPLSTIFEIKDYSLAMQEVAGGTFMMGSEEYDDEKPIHQVELSSFLLGKYPVRQGLWEAVMGNNPSSFQGLDRPVEGVNWYEATEFCNALSDELGKTAVYSSEGENIKIDYDATGFRLPTEAEWEYAARGGKHKEGYNYAGGDEAHLVAWYNGNSHDETKPVGLKAPNALGLYDMSGNVWEWCNDWYGAYQKPKKGVQYVTSLFKKTNGLTAYNPQGPEKGDYRVIRGGSWYYYPGYMRVADRDDYHPVLRHFNVGFRLCLPQF